ncbi:Uncharacterised protein [Yersinia aldovae]|nr:Uncharacterised protein [Yersinia aldovae]
MLNVKRGRLKYPVAAERMAWDRTDWIVDMVQG